MSSGDESGARQRPRADRFRANLLITASALLLLLGCLSFRELIPARHGIGYDGKYHAQWVRTLSIGDLVGAATARTQAEIRDAMWIDSYSVRRVLPAVLIGEVLHLLDAQTTDENIIRAFTAANIVLLVLTVFMACRSADALAISQRGKWLIFFALLVSYSNLKMPLFYPILTDTTALALGSASLLCFLEGRCIALLLVALIGTFTWPTLAYFAFLLLVFPKQSPTAPTHRLARLETALCALAATGALVLADVMVSTHTVESTQVEPLLRIRILSAGLVGIYVFLALRPLTDLRAIGESLRPARLVRATGFWLAILLLIASEGSVNAIAILPPRIGADRFIMDTFYTSATQPGIFFLAHVLYFGPVMLFLLFLWPQVCENIKRHGPGLVACFGLAAVVSVGSESRKLVNFLPFVVVFLVETLDSKLTNQRLVVLALLCVLFSKIWLPMDQPLVLPFLGHLSWRGVYVTSRGPWITHGAYALQLAVVSVVMPLFWWWSRGRKPAVSR